MNSGRKKEIDMALFSASNEGYRDSIGIKGIAIIALFLFGFGVISQATTKKASLAYIERWRETAEEQQNEYGIPACITLAQALLESSAGESELALNANNHFGIKCTSDWFGEVYRHDDDKKSECFRVYLDARESFKDHSLFLQRDRYQQLFTLDMSDYKAWAYGLKECGYATDPLYPTKLIRIIEEYELACGAGVPTAEQYTPPSQHTSKKQTTTRYTAKKQPTDDDALSSKRPVLVSKPDPIMIITSDPEPEYQEPRTAAEEKKLFFLLHKKMKQNGCSYILAKDGDTYASIAFSLNIKERTLRIWNDALDRPLQINDRVYVAKKKKYGEKEKAILWVHPDESLWFISQREGMQLNTIYKLNGLDKRVRIFKTRQKILLRKLKNEK